MIVVQVPLRISFLGGGTDFKEFYLNHGGTVLSTAIDKCVFVIIRERFDDMIYVNYSKKEIVDSLDKLEHELVREAMRITGVTKGVEITTLADVPASGTGLGSSSSITVGLLQALYTYRGELKTAKTLAQEACHIEVDILQKPIGKQDQYIAAYGNMRLITFNKNAVKVEKIELSPEDKRRLNDAFLLFYTGVTRQSSEILSEQKANINQRLEVLSEMKRLAFKGRDAILQNAFDEFGEIMHQGWELKKRLASKITSSKIDEIYEAARKAGAIGGKITGAGGGGFLLLYCPKHRQDEVRRALKGLRELPFRFEQDGSKVIFNYRSMS
ncbi:GHMP kinase [Dehalococcoidia bacterium]|nr:GHMP kinase [Dehalococcoidia bacterium]